MLDVLRRQLGQSLISQARLEVFFYGKSDPVKCAWPDRSPHAFQPLIQPLREGHAALFSEVYTTIGFDFLPQLGGQLLLGVRVDVAEDGSPIVLMAHYDAAFPAPVVPFADHAIPGGPAFCHVCHLPFWYNSTGVLPTECGENSGILQFFPDFPAQSEPGGEVFLGHFLPELLLHIQEAAETGAAAFQFRLQLIEYLLDLDQLLSVVRHGSEPLLQFSHMV